MLLRLGVARAAGGEAACGAVRRGAREAHRRCRAAGRVPPQHTGGARATPVRDIWHTFPRPSGLLTHVVVPGSCAWSGLDQLERTALDHWVCVVALAVDASGGRRWGVGAATALPALIEGDGPDGARCFDDHQASAEYRRHILGVVAQRLIERSGG